MRSIRGFLGGNKKKGGGETSRIIFLNSAQVRISTLTRLNHFRLQNVTYKSNQISTAKYNLITFLPRFLFEQFRR